MYLGFNNLQTCSEIGLIHLFGMHSNDEVVKLK